MVVVGHVDSLQRDPGSPTLITLPTATGLLTASPVAALNSPSE
jgi:hypothetical protein